MELAKVTEVQFWVNCLPKKDAESILEKIASVYAEELVQWADGTGKFPSALTKMKLAPTKAFWKDVKAKGKEGVTHYIKQLLCSGNVEDTIKKLCYTRNPNVEALLNDLIRNHIASILTTSLININPILKSINPHTFETFPYAIHYAGKDVDKLYTVTRNIVAVYCNFPSVYPYQYTPSILLFQTLRDISMQDQGWIAQKVLKEFVDKWVQLLDVSYIYGNFPILIKGLYVKVFRTNPSAFSELFTKFVMSALQSPPSQGLHHSLVLQVIQPIVKATVKYYMETPEQCDAYKNIVSNLISVGSNIDLLYHMINRLVEKSKTIKSVLGKEVVKELRGYQSMIRLLKNSLV